MSSARTAPRTTSTMNKAASSFHAHHTNGSGNNYETNDSSNNIEFDSGSNRSSVMKTISQAEGLHRNPRFIHALSVGLLGQQVIVRTNNHERYHGVFETISPNGDIALTVAHRLDNNVSSDSLTLSSTPLDIIDTIDSSAQTFELQKQTIPAASIIEIVAADIDMTGSNKCILEETTKLTPLEHDRFNRMESFYDSQDIDPETFEDLEIGDDGKAGYDPEDMFHTNREKFNTMTDYDESKYTNVPLRQMSPSEMAEIERKATEIERGSRYEDIDEDDAGVKRPAEHSQSHPADDGNSNVKNNPSSRSHPNDRRTDNRYDSENNSSKRANWRDQRSGVNSGNSRRGGGPNNYSSNNPKQSQRSDQNQYTSSRSNDQSSNNRQQQYNNRSTRSTNFNDNRSPHEGRDSPSQTNPDEPTRGQRINSGSFSQGPNSGSTSPSTAAPSSRTIYSNNRVQNNRNSPAPYSGSSSSRHSSTNATSPTSNSYQTNPTTTGNYSQQPTNKTNKKLPRNTSHDHPGNADETDSSKSQNHQQQQQPQPSQQQSTSSSQVQQQHPTPLTSSASTSTAPLNRPSQLHTQPNKQNMPSAVPSQNQQQHPTSHQHQPSISQQHQPAPPSNNIPQPLTLPPQDDHQSSHDMLNTNQSDATSHMNNPAGYVQTVPNTVAMATTGGAKSMSDLNPEADEFVPGQPRESNSRPESRGATANALQPNPFIQHPHPQGIHLLQHPATQQQQPHHVQTLQMIQPPHAQPSGTIYSSYYPAPFSGMPTLVNTAQQPMNLSMMSSSIMPQPQIPNNSSNTNTAGTAGMTNASANPGPGYKNNSNQVHGSDVANNGVNNNPPKKAVVSLAQTDQTNAPQQQQVVSGTPIAYVQTANRIYPDYITQQGPPTMSMTQVPLYYSMTPSNIIQASNVGPAQNMMVTPATSSAGPVPSTPTQYFYPGVYPDHRQFNAYQPGASMNPAGVTQNWQMNRSPPHHQQQGQVNEQQRSYNNNPTGQNMVAQGPPPTNAPNPAAMQGRSASASGPSGQNGSAGQPITLQYPINGNMPGNFQYASAGPWYPGPQSVSSPQTPMQPQVNAFNMFYDTSQQQPMSQQASFIHQNPYESSYYTTIQAQQPSTQQGLGAAPPGNYNR